MSVTLVTLVTMAVPGLSSGSSYGSHGTCQYVRTGERWSDDCFAEKECMDKCSEVRIKQTCEAEPVCNVTYVKKCTPYEENVRFII